MLRTYETKILMILLVAVFLFVGCKAQQDQVVFKSNGKVDYPLSNSDEKLLDSIQYRSFLFFKEQSNT